MRSETEFLPASRYGSPLLFCGDGIRDRASGIGESRYIRGMRAATMGGWRGKTKQKTRSVEHQDCGVGASPTTRWEQDSTAAHCRRVTAKIRDKAVHSISVC